MNYLKAVLKKDQNRKIAELKNIIKLGKQLKKDVRPDIKKLEILLGRKVSSTSTSNKKENKTSSSKTSNIRYSISKVYTNKNKIIVKFNKTITKKDIKTFELNQKPVYKDVFDINGYFKDAKPTKLAIKGVDKIAIGQNKPNVLRIVFAHKKNLKTSYTIKNKELILSVDDLKSTKNTTKKTVKKEPVKKPKFVIKDDMDDLDKKIAALLVDKENSIRSLTTKDNLIIVKFNKDFSKKLLKYTAFKNSGKYHDIFDIKGEYAHTKPLKLKIPNLDRIYVTNKGSDSVRITISHHKDIRVYYYIKKRELKIKVVGLEEKKEEVKAVKKVVKKPAKKPTVVKRKRINKTIVIDAGHGAHDVGAVGPKKRYEKVVTLKVAKYLYSILKQRGYKVYLTRHRDKFIKVGHRTILANKKKADIFISIHANSVPKSKAHKVKGIETFFLSPARSERAKRVAAKENKSDIRKMNSSSKKAFLESLNRPRITASHKLAIDSQAGMLQAVRSKYTGVKDSGVREGPFWVLVGAQMPSILVELGYMSHPVESARLYSSKYQKLLANGLANGVDSYFSKNP